MQRLPSPRVNNVIRGLACHYAREQPALRCSFLAEVLKRSNSLRSGGTESTAHGLSSLVADAERLGNAQHIKDTSRPRRATIASSADISPASSEGVQLYWSCSNQVLDVRGASGPRKGHPVSHGQFDATEPSMTGEDEDGRGTSGALGMPHIHIGAAFRVLFRRPVIPRGFSHTQPEICRTRYGLHYPRDLVVVDPDLTGAEYCHVVPPFFVFRYILSIRTYSPTTNDTLLLRGRRAGESARFFLYDCTHTQEPLNVPVRIPCCCARARTAPKQLPQFTFYLHPYSLFASEARAFWDMWLFLDLDAVF